MNTGKNHFYSFGLLVLLIYSTFIPKCGAPLAKKTEFPYHVSEPAEKYTLKHSLAEVSGLSFVSDKEVALIEDENGSIFFFDLEKSTITRKISFAKDGDYEDLKIKGDTAYIIRSDGRLFELLKFKGASFDIVENKYSTGLGKDNNTEGLCYDDQRKLLLIACKGRPGRKGDDKKYKNKKAIYSFNPETKLLSDTPLFLIDINEVETLAYGKRQNVIEKFMRFYRKTKKTSFEPSGLSIHPLTHELYVISSVGNLLVVIDTAGKITHVVKLPPSVFKQPEGITFDQQGNMYISNEGRKGKGNILKFLYLTDHLNS